MKKAGKNVVRLFVVLLVLTGVYNLNLMYAQNKGSAGKIDNPAKTNSLSTAADITLLQPNGGEEWETGDNVRIQWTSTDIDDVLIWLSVNNGSSWYKTLINDGLQLPASNNYFDWTVPDLPTLGFDISTNNALVRVVDASNELVFDDSDTTFVINITPKLYIIDDYFSDIVTFYHQFNTTENFSAVQLQYRLHPTSANNWVVAQNSMTGDVTNITGSTGGSIRWSTASENLLSDYEGLIEVRIRFTSAEGSDFYLSVNPVGIDNVNPQLDSTDVVISQIPEYSGFSVLGMKFADAASRSGKYSFSVTLASDFGYNVSKSTDADSLTFENIRTSTNYLASITIEDATGNTQTITKHYKSTAFTDYTLDGKIDYLDAAVIALYVSDASHRARYPASIDIFPLSGTIPFVVQLGNSKIFNTQDFLQFALMRNYYLENNNTLPKLLHDNGTLNILPAVLLENDGDFIVKLKEKPDEQALSGRFIFSADFPFTVTDVKIVDEKSRIVGTVFSHYDSLHNIALFDFVDFEWMTEKELYLSGKISKKGQDNYQFNSFGNTINYEYDLINSSIQSFNNGEGDLVINSSAVPSSFKLHQNYPNPFNPSTTIVYEIPIQTDVRVTVYGVAGEEIVTLVNENRKPGRYEVEITELQNYPSGVYFYKLSAGSFNATKKMILLK